MVPSAIECDCFLLRKASINRHITWSLGLGSIRPGINVETSYSREKSFLH